MMTEAECKDLLEHAESRHDAHARFDRRLEIARNVVVGIFVGMAALMGISVLVAFAAAIFGLCGAHV